MEYREHIKKALLETMDLFHAFCEEHGLVYYLVGGGLIGAIRHKGLIPWDDDLDVIMPQDDFNKLVALQSEFSAPFFLEERRKDKDYYRCCIALVNKRVLIDPGACNNQVTGVSLDILCLNKTFNTPTLRNMHFSMIHFARGLYIIKGKTYLRKGYNKKVSVVLSLLSLLFKMIPKSLFLTLLDLLENIVLVDSDIYANLHGAWGSSEYVSSTCLEKRQLYLFEGREYWSMTLSNADIWLSNIYGNYMQLPPEEKQVYRHIGEVVKVRSDI